MSTRREFLTLVSAGLVLSACSFGESATTRNLKALHAYIKANLAPLESLGLDNFDASSAIGRLAKQLAPFTTATSEQLRQVLVDSVNDDSREGRFFTQGNVMVTQTEALIFAVASGRVDEGRFSSAS